MMKVTEVSLVTFIYKRKLLKNNNINEWGWKNKK